MPTLYIRRQKGKIMSVICSGFGHAEAVYFDHELAVVERYMRLLIEDHGVDTFYSGTHGNFDLAFANIVYSLKSDYPHIQNVLILSHPPYSKFGHIELPEKYDYSLYLLEEPCFYKQYVTRTNRAIVDRSAFVIAAVIDGLGGAYSACLYAKRKCVPILNIYHDIFERFPLPDFAL